MRASFVANKSSVSFQDNRAPGDHSHPCSDKFVHIQAGCRWGGAGLHERRTEICGGYFLLFIFFSELAPRPRTFPILSSYIRIGAADFAAPSPFRLIHYPHTVRPRAPLSGQSGYRTSPLPPPKRFNQLLAKSIIPIDTERNRAVLRIGYLHHFQVKLNTSHSNQDQSQTKPNVLHIKMGVFQPKADTV